MIYWAGRSAWFPKKPPVFVGFLGPEPGNPAPNPPPKGPQNRPQNCPKNGKFMKIRFFSIFVVFLIFLIAVSRFYEWFINDFLTKYQWLVDGLLMIYK